MNELMIILFENDWLLYAACGAAGIGGLIQIVLSVIYNRSLNASERMRNTKIAWLRQMKTRYESGYEWNNRIRNVELFVDKNIGRRKWMGIYLKTWEELSRLMLILVLLFSALGAVCAGTYKEEKAMPLIYLATGAVLAVLLWGLIVLANLKEKQRLLRTNLCDYFENTLQGEAKNRHKENLKEREVYFGKQTLREELACAVENEKEQSGQVAVTASEKKEEIDAELQMKPESTETAKQRKEAEKSAKAAAKSNKKAVRQERKRDKQLEKLAKKETKSLKKKEKQLAKEVTKKQRRQEKEQKRVDKLAKRMKKMQLRLGTAAAAEGLNVAHAVGGKKEESARIKREQLKRKVDVTPAQEDQIISEVLREFLA